MNYFMEENLAEEHRRDISTRIDQHSLARTGIKKQGLSPQLVHARHAETRSMVDRAWRRIGGALRGPCKTTLLKHALDTQLEPFTCKDTWAIGVP